MANPEAPKGVDQKKVKGKEKPLTPEQLKLKIKEEEKMKEREKMKVKYPAIAKVVEGSNWELGEETDEYASGNVSTLMKVDLKKNYADKMPKEVKEYFRANRIAFPELSLAIDPKNNQIDRFDFEHTDIITEARWDEDKSTGDEIQFQDLFDGKDLTKEVLKKIEQWIIGKCTEFAAIGESDEGFYSQIEKLGKKYGFNNQHGREVLTYDQLGKDLGPKYEKDREKLNKKYPVDVSVNRDGTVADVTFNTIDDTDIKSQSRLGGGNREALANGAFVGKKVSPEVLVSIKEASLNMLRKKLDVIKEGKQK